MNDEERMALGLENPAVAHDRHAGGARIADEGELVAADAGVVQTPVVGSQISAV